MFYYITNYYYNAIILNEQVYGIAPCCNHSRMPTRMLAESIIKYMRAPGQKLQVYTKHLALLVSRKE